MKCGFCGKVMKGDCFEPCKVNPAGFCIPDFLYDGQEMRSLQNAYNVKEE